MSTSWCLDFARTVFTAVFGSESRHRKMAVHRSRGDEENMLIMAVAAYAFESKARGTSKGRGKRHWSCCMCVGIRRKYRRKVQKTQRNLFGNPAWKLSVHTHTHTHTFYHSWQILGTAHQKGAIKVCCVQSSKRLWLSHQLAATQTHCARRAEGRVHRSAACEIKKKLGHLFSISKWPEGSRSVLCPVFVQLCPSHQLDDSYCVHAAGRAACEIKYKFGHHFSVTQFGSPTAQRSLLNLAVQQTKGLGLTWKFLITTASYMSHKPMLRSLNRSKRSWVDLESSLFFVSSPPSRKNSTNQKLAPISCAGNISSIWAPAHGPWTQLLAKIENIN